MQEFAADVAGLYYRRHGRAYLFVNGAHHVVRQRFTLAHEFGHHHMGHSPRVESTEGMLLSKDTQEVQANSFAGEFLAPRQAVRNWSERYPELSGLELVVRAGAFFGISAEASRIALGRAGVIGKAECSRLRGQIASREHYGLSATLGVDGHEDALSALAREVETGHRTLPRLPAELVRGAHDLLVWTQRLLLTGELAKSEPKRLRYRLLHVAGRLSFHARTATLRIQATWPWANDLTTAFARLRTFPTPTG